MYYPLTIRDFIDRAELVYPDRIAVVDEPDQPAAGLGEVTYREMGVLARAQAARLDRLGVPVGGRVAVISQNSARLLTSFFGVSAWGRVLVPINFRLAKPEIEYIVAAQRGSGRVRRSCLQGRAGRARRAAPVRVR